MQLEWPRVVTIYGGKPKVYRTTAEKLVAKFASLLPKRVIKVRTSNLRLGQTR